MNVYSSWLHHHALRGSPFRSGTVDQASRFPPASRYIVHDLGSRTPVTSGSGILREVFANLGSRFIDTPHGPHNTTAG